VGDQHVYDGVTQAELPNDPNYHFMTDVTEEARAWIGYQKALTPDKPAFVYFAPGATHAPHHVPKEWIAKWKGKFDQGWDKLREETLARQIKMGIVPPDTKLAPKPPAIKDWDALSADEQRLFARQAEVFAAFADYTDHEIGRMLDAFAEVGEADNTLVFYVAGDNGTSGEGGRTSLTLAEGMTGMMENAFLNVKNRSKTITAEIEVPAGGANGTVLAQGGRFGGWSLYVKDGVPAYDYNFLGLQRSSVAASKPLAPGKARIRLDFAYDGGGPGKGGLATLFVNDEKVAEGRIANTQAGMFSADETADVGIDLGTPVVEAIGSEACSRFTGRIPKVEVAVQ
jgi:hypothetical protein